MFDEPVRNGSNPGMTASQEQLDYWNGAGGQRWVRYQEALDRMVRPFGLAAMERLQLQPGEHVLDVGCGCGETTLALAERVGAGGSVTGIDLSAPMLARARERNPGAELIAGNAAEHAFTRSFDAIFSRFGVMFFADPVAAFAHLRASLAAAANGRMAFVCWRAEAENAWARVPFAAVRGALPEAPLGVQDRASGPGPFAFADASAVERMLRHAGYGQVDVAPFDCEVELASNGLDAATSFALTAGPAARLLVQASDADRQRAAAAVRAAIAPYLTHDRVALPGAAWVVFARAA